MRTVINNNKTVGVYDVRITPVNAIGGGQVRLYIAADFIGAAIRKAQRVCAESAGFRPFRGNSSIGITRMGEAALKANPKAFVEALSHAEGLNEGDIVAALRSLFNDGCETFAVNKDNADQLLRDAFAAQ